MTQKSEAVLSDALSMPEEDRALLAERLIASLDHAYEKDTELAWQNELNKRITEIDGGMVVCIPWEQVRTQLS